MSLKNNKTKDLKDRAPLVLIILDGWGLEKPSKGNAITQAKTPTFDKLMAAYPCTTLYTYGKYVGLPSWQVGNSEAGHMNIGAGRVVKQDSVYISEAIKDGTFFKNLAFLEAIQHVQKNKSNLHLIGILSNDQCPHMSPDHLIALSKLAYDNGLPVFLHLFTDGRDAPVYAGATFWQELQPKLSPKTHAASVAGRIYLDRKKKWSRTEQIYNLLVLGNAKYQAKDFAKAVYMGYEREQTDEFISPTIIRNKQVTAKHVISDNDSIIFFNLRSDRARQLAKPFVQEDFESKNQDSFARSKILRNIKFVAMTDFGPDLGQILSAYPSRDVVNTLPVALGQHYKQLYIAEMEKYAHITYFLNGGYEKPIAGENRILVRSADVDSYDTVPAMSAREVTGVVVESLKQKLYNFICVNFANSDMLGHTGNIKATVKGCEVVDKCLAKILSAIKAGGGEAIITADHGNAEVMLNEDPQSKIHTIVNTTHDKSPVPFIVYSDKKIKLKGRSNGKMSGKLGDIAPTILDLVGIKKPKEMSGQSLIIN